MNWYEHNDDKPGIKPMVTIGTIKHREGKPSTIQLSRLILGPKGGAHWQEIISIPIDQWNDIVDAWIQHKEKI